MKFEKLLAGLSVMAVLASCELSQFEEDSNPVMPEQTNVQEESSLFKPDGQNNLFTFETNDTKYLTANGWTIWSVPNVNGEERFVPLTVEAVKESGRAEAGFGIVFCAQEIEGRPFMLSVLINANGYYTAGKVSDGVFSHINGGWKSPGCINRGHGIKNTISVSYDTAGNNFLLKINGYEITEFAAPKEIAFKNSRSGFAVVIAGNENFPDNPVKITFENK